MSTSKTSENQINEVRNREDRPNYFIGIRISEPSILVKIKEIQTHIVEGDGRLRKGVVSTNTTHVTLCLLSLNNEEQIKKAIKILKQSKVGVTKILNSKGQSSSESGDSVTMETGGDVTPLKLTLSGLGHFDHKVLFVRVLDDENLNKLMKISEFLEDQLKDLVPKKDFNSFKPHITIMKLSKVPSYQKRKNKLKKIAPALYEPYTVIMFGVQQGESLDLLSMSKPKTNTGYYFSEAGILINDAKTDLSEN